MAPAAPAAAPLREDPEVGALGAALMEALKEAGYATAHIGKWHLAAHDDQRHRHFLDHFRRPRNGSDLHRKPDLPPKLSIARFLLDHYARP